MIKHRDSSSMLLSHINKFISTTLFCRYQFSFTGINGSLCFLYPLAAVYLVYNALQITPQYALVMLGSVIFYAFIVLF